MPYDMREADVLKLLEIQKYRRIQKKVMRLTEDSKPLLGDAI